MGSSPTASDKESHQQYRLRVETEIRQLEGFLADSEAENRRLRNVIETALALMSGALDRSAT